MALSKYANLFFFYKICDVRKTATTLGRSIFTIFIMHTSVYEFYVFMRFFAPLGRAECVFYTEFIEVNIFISYSVRGKCFFPNVFQPFNALRHFFPSL